MGRTIITWLWINLSLAVGAIRCDDVCSIRGTETLSRAREPIVKFLSDTTPSVDVKFHVQGWRWHTMSLARESERLQKLAESCSGDSKGQYDALAKAVNYVVGFNMKGLHKIERDLFFPWVKNKVNGANNPELASAVGAVMDQLELRRQEIEDIGHAMLADFSSPTSATDVVTIAGSVASNSARISGSVRWMLDLSDALLVPTIARVVPESEQKAFNNRVIRNLGLWDSRLHLVSMHEAVWELKDEKERELFQETIPSIPRAMIPRWKRLLYEPQAGMLESVR